MHRSLLTHTQVSFTWGGRHLLDVRNDLMELRGLGLATLCLTCLVYGVLVRVRHFASHSWFREYLLGCWDAEAGLMSHMTRHRGKRDLISGLFCYDVRSHVSNRVS